jgi:hypothetical protein
MIKIIAHEKPGKRRTWEPHGQHGYSLGPAMHHYRCQNVYISATAQLSSTDRLLMAANDMSNALQNPHPNVPFTHVGDDIISALTALAEIFKLKFQQVHIPKLPSPPAKVTQRTCLAASSNPILASPMPPPRQTRSQTKFHAPDITNAPLLPRVVTPMTSQPSPPRVPRRSHNLSPRNLSQDNFCGMDTAQMASPWETTIGTSSIKPMQSFTPSPEKKWKTWPS